jgi:hypothetical protein
VSEVYPTIDKRLAAVCQRLRARANEIEEGAVFGEVHLFVHEHVIKSHRSWKIEMDVPELEQYLCQPELSEQVPLHVRSEEACAMLRRVVEECRGVRGIESPCVPSPELLQEIANLLKRAPERT